MADITGLATAAAQRNGVPADVFLRLVNAESSGDPNTPPSSKGAIGPAQLMPGTAKDLGVDPYDTAQNLEGGARYLRQQYDRFGDWTKAVAAYNGGPTRVARAGGVPNITETKDYVGKVMGASAPQDENLPSALDLLGGGQAQAQSQPQSQPQVQPGAQPDQGTPTPADLVQPMPSQPKGAPQPRAVTGASTLNPAAMADAEKAAAGTPDAVRSFGNGITFNFGNKADAGLAAGETWLTNNVGPMFGGQKVAYTPGQAYDAMLAADKAHEAAFAKSHPLSDAGLNILGGMFAPLPKGLGGVKGGAVAGGLSGVGSADHGNEGAAGMFGAGVGALTGLVAPALAQQAAKGATAAARPVVNAVSDWTSGAIPKIPLPTLLPQNARQQLASEGVNLTMGQAYPWLKPVEDFAEKLPFVGGGVKAAQGRAVDSFNTAAVNRVLKPLGETVPAGVHAGNDAVAYAQQRVGQAYDRVLSQIHGVQPDKAFLADVSNATTGLVNGKAGAPLQPAEQAHLNSLAKWVQGSLKSGADGNAVKHVTSELGKLVSPSNSPEFNSRLAQLRQAVMGATMRSNPAQAADLMKADAAYGLLTRVQKAAAGASNTGGVFTPQQLGAKVVAADKSASKRVSAAGNAPMQDLAQAGGQVLGRAKPNGGNGGGHGGGILAGLLGGEMLEPWLAHHPAVAAATTGGLGLLTLPYTPAGQKAINAAVKNGVSSVGQNTRRFVQQNVPALMPYIGGRLPQPQPNAQTRR